MNIAKRKELLDYHINMATHIGALLKDVDYSQLYGIEHEIISAEKNTKEIMTKLEAKMVR